MDFVGLAILVVVIVAVVAIVAWYVRKTGIVIPQPVLIVFWAAIAIIAILVIASLAGLGGPRWGR